MGKRSMIGEYAKDRELSDKLLPQARKIISDCAGVSVDEVIIAPREDDILRNSDLLLLETREGRIAFRVRRWKWFEEYAMQVTFRYWRKRNGCDGTDFMKVMSGYGDYMLYGFANASETEIIPWRYLDLRIFRMWIIQCCWPPSKRKDNVGEVITNTDGTKFIAFDIQDIEDYNSQFVVAKCSKNPDGIIK